LGSIWQERKLWTPVTKYGLLSMGMSFINPYFFKGVAYPFRQFQLLQGSNIFKYTISELLSPISLKMYSINGTFVLFQPLFWFQIFLAVSTIIFIMRLKRIKLNELLIFLFFFFLGCTAIKNIGFYIFAILPATIQGIQPSDPAPNTPKRSWLIALRIQTVLNGIVIVLSIILIKSIITDAYYINYRSNFRFGYKYSNTLLPYKASQYLRNYRMEGKMLNDLQSGGFLISQLPQKVSIDGRLEVMGEEFYSKYTFLWNNIKKDKILAEYRPDIVLFPYQNEFLWVHHFKKDTAWRLQYFDEYAAVYIKKGYADTIPPFTYNEQLSQYKKIEQAQIDSILRREYPRTPQILRLTSNIFL
jgi:hypothetical protein